MLEALKFVNRATADKDIIRALTHICVHDGKLQGADSRMAIEADCPELAGHSFTAPAEKFIKAVVGCAGTPSIAYNQDGTIKVSHGRFRVTLPTLRAEDFPIAVFKPDDAVKIDAPDGLLDALRRVFPFISQDASRPWSLGAYIHSNYIYATNNVTMARTPVAWNGPAINLPRYVVQELLDINQPILEVWAGANSVSFKFQGAWLRAQLYVDQWPGGVFAMFDKPKEYSPVPEGLLPAIEKLLPFCPDVKFPSIHFKDGEITTAKGIQSAEIGFDWDGVGVYRAEVLQLVLAVAQQWTPSTYPSPVFFKGDRIEGMLVGIRA